MTTPPGINRIRMVRAIVLDVDGTLVDSNAAHTRAWAAAFAANGVAASFWKVRASIGIPADRLVTAVAGCERDTELSRRIQEDYERIFLTHFLPELHPFPMARQLLEHLRADRLRVAAISQCSDRVLDGLLAVIGEDGLIEVRVAGMVPVVAENPAAGVEGGADLVARALAALGCTPSEALLIGDTPYDVEGAQRAGVDAIALRSGGWADRALAGAVALFDDLVDLLEQYKASAMGSEARPAATR